MKRIHYIFIAALLFINYSCERNLTSEGVSKITNYVVMTVVGEPFMSVAKGSAFTDPGVTAMEGDVVATVTTTGAVDANAPGVYTLKYTAVNKEGYSVSESRIVCVYDPQLRPTIFQVIMQGLQINHWPFGQKLPLVCTQLIILVEHPEQI